MTKPALERIFSTANGPISKIFLSNQASSNVTESEEVLKAAISSVVEKTLGKKTCIRTNHPQNSSVENVDSTAAGDAKKLPGVDIFLNPAKADEKTNIVEAKQGIAKDYFKTSDMAELYPNLFRILWQSTLPCFQVNISKIPTKFDSLMSVSHFPKRLRSTNQVICVHARRMAWKIIF